MKTPPSFTFTLPEPPSANRWWRSTVIKSKKTGKHRSMMHLSAEARKYKADVAEAGAKLKINYPGDVAVHVLWFRGMESGDLDKRLGIVLDALQGVFYRNDGQITKLSAERRLDRLRPRVVVTVSRVDATLFDQVPAPTPRDVLKHLTEIAEHFRAEHPNDDGGYMTGVDEAVDAARRLLANTD